MRLAATIGKVTPKHGLALLAPRKSHSSDFITDGAREILNTIRRGHCFEGERDAYVGYAVVAWTEDGSATVEVRSEGGIPFLLVPTFAEEAIRGYIQERA